MIKFIAALTNTSFNQSIKLYNHLYKTDYHRDPMRIILEEEVNQARITFDKGLDYPFEYYLGSVDFLDCTIKINNDTLIPRVETEELVRMIHEDYKGSKGLSLLDLCTGTGVIAISLAKKIDFSLVYASDISPQALEVAKINAINNGVSINFLQGDYLQPCVDHSLTFDLLVSNPPYIGLNDEVGPGTFFEPEIALYCPENGLASYRKIFSQLDLVLNPGGHAYLEISSLHIKELESIINKTINTELFDFHFKKDLFGRYRFLLIKKHDLS